MEGKDVVVIVYRFEKMWTILIYRMKDKMVFGINFYHLS